MWRPDRFAIPGDVVTDPVTTASRSCPHAALNASPPLTRRAVGGVIRAMPSQTLLEARAGSGLTAVAVAAPAPLGWTHAKQVSVT